MVYTFQPPYGQSPDVVEWPFPLVYAGNGKAYMDLWHWYVHHNIMVRRMRLVDLLQMRKSNPIFSESFELSFGCTATDFYL